MIAGLPKVVRRETRMSMNQDLGFEPSDLNKIVLLESGVRAEDLLAKKFKLRVVELAKQGTFGSLKTRKSSLQNSYTQLASLVDRTHVPLLIYGETGSGKRRLVEELLSLQNFFRRMQNKDIGNLKVFEGSTLSRGFSELFKESACCEADLIYIQNIDALGEECQKELLDFIEGRKAQTLRGEALPRLVVSTEKALSIMVVRKEFLRGLFQSLSTQTIFLPSLNERQEDLIHIVQSYLDETLDLKGLPSHKVIDALSHYLWPENIDELQKVLSALARKNSDPQSWTVDDMPEAFQPKKEKSKFSAAALRFKMGDAPDVTESQKEREILRRTLKDLQGNRELVAQKLGMPRQELLKKLMSYGLR